ncbi:hypothetical protein [Spongiactinospora sp. TRM90649]|uniref:hypothetical protein n=1 Tax=Spongiactinospora sp. TRM90649 TaxID=3031114 RepID=UPI0023F7B342|nr:hypothetical protein [Spongiactinospora sp. TRM90649]MDF5751778.1 hypothetical protein [Spongiactinospora sp. TRM90649]
MTSPPGGGRKKRPVLIPVIAVLLATGLGATAVLGGLDRLPDPPPLTLKQGDVLDQGLFRTRFVGATLTTVAPRNTWDKEKRLLDLMFKVTSHADKTMPVGGPPDPGQPSAFFMLFGGSLLRTDPVLKTEFGGIAKVVDNGSESGQLHPGTTSTVRIRYDLPENTRVPDEIVLEMGGFELQQRFPSELVEWTSITTEVAEHKFAAEVAARVTLPIMREDA